MGDKPGFIGRSVERKEDYRFLTGNGQYTDDITQSNQSYAYFLRSPHAHAQDHGRSTSRRRRRRRGVLGVFIGEDVAAEVGGLPCGWLINNRTASR
ncbi:MAG: hypothetical protein U5L03_04255 [Burkholderiaceae bacterium]|nr:hypothetical protein [Burkholderiaceae bacterium]